MRRNQEKISACGVVVLLFALLNAVVLEQSYVANQSLYQATYITFPLLLISIIAFRKSRK
jgi:hypothetical protein